jgi:ferredoxin-NADP reductase
MIRDIFTSGAVRRFHLLYGSRSDEDILYRDELCDIAERHPNIRIDHVVMEPTSSWRGRTGLLDARVIGELAGPLANRMVYVCGPQAMYPYALAQLAELGHRRRRIRFEANGAPSRPNTQLGWPAGLSPAAVVTVRVKDGPTFTTTCGTTLLDALESHRIHPPVACRSGECSLCRVRIVSGEVFNPTEAHLRRADAQFGYVHSCVAYPVSDLEIQLG